MKQKDSLNHREYREVCKAVQKKIPEDCRKFRIKEVTERMKGNTRIKEAKKQLSLGEKRISCFLGKSGEPITNQDLILERIEEFYTELYASNNQSESHQAALHPEIPEATQSEVRHVLNRMPNGKASGPDGVSVETLKAG